MSEIVQNFFRDEIELEFNYDNGFLNKVYFEFNSFADGIYSYHYKVDEEQTTYLEFTPKDSSDVILLDKMLGKDLLDIKASYLRSYFKTIILDI